MIRVLFLFLVYFSVGCSERPRGTVCDANDEISVFMCTASKVYITDVQFVDRRAFYLSQDLGARADLNLKENFKEIENLTSRLDIGGYNERVLGAVIEKVSSLLQEEGYRARGSHVVVVDAGDAKESILSSLSQLGFEITFAPESRN